MTKAEAIATLPQSSNAASEAVAYLLGAAVIGGLIYLMFALLVCKLDDLALKRRVKHNLPLH